MKKTKQLQFVLACAAVVLGMGCNSQKETAGSERSAQRPQGQQRGQQGPPSVDQIFQMDANRDGFLSRSEVKGPLLNDFSRIDTDNNGLISRTEMANAPRPQRGGQPPRR